MVQNILLVKIRYHICQIIDFTYSLHIVPLLHLVGAIKKIMKSSLIQYNSSYRKSLNNMIFSTKEKTCCSKVVCCSNHLVNQILNSCYLYSETSISVAILFQKFAALIKIAIIEFTDLKNHTKPRYLQLQ